MTYKPEIESTDAATFTVIIKETSVGYPGGFSATANMVIEVRAWQPCEATGFTPIHDYMERKFIYYAQSNSTMNITVGGTVTYKDIDNVKTTVNWGSYQTCGFRD